MTEEKFIFTGKIKKQLLIWGAVGVVLVVAGLILTPDAAHHEEAANIEHGVHPKVDIPLDNKVYDASPEADMFFDVDALEEEAEEGDVAHDQDSHMQAADEHGPEESDFHHAEEAGHGEDHHGGGIWKRFMANLWVNNIFFTGIAVIGLFFVAFQYAAQAGWSASIKRIPEAFGAWLPFAGILVIAVYLIGNHDIFHWTHTYLYDKSSPEYDEIINGKKGFFFWPLNESLAFPAFYFVRMVLYFVIWYGMFYLIRKASIQEDIHGGDSYWYQMRKYSAIFLVLFAVTSSTSAWDWVMSIDTHWFSTLFGWYVFASWFVAGLCTITLITVLLKEAGYLKMVNSNHLHDLGKFIFAFSIFWTYIWISQFLLIYYANIPEETIYFIERMESDFYTPVFFINLILNFFFPFLVLMTRDAKRHTIFLKIVCVVVLIGHWIDFYLMVMPGVMGQDGGFGLIEIGTPLIYGSLFLFVILGALAKPLLVAKNHPMLQESVHHHI